MLAVKPPGKSIGSPICRGGFAIGPPFAEVVFRGVCSLWAPPHAWPCATSSCMMILSGAPALFPEWLGLRDIDGSLSCTVLSSAFCPPSVVLLHCQGRPQSQDIKGRKYMLCVQYRFRVQVIGRSEGFLWGRESQACALGPLREDGLCGPGRPT